MKLKCIYSRNDAFTVGKEYKATVISKDREYFFITDEDNILRSVPLDGGLWGFEIVSTKASITVEQALQDGFVKIKSLKRCIKENLFDPNKQSFINVQNNPGFNPYMPRFFGKIIQVTDRYNTILVTREWNWPIEVIEK